MEITKKEILKTPNDLSSFFTTLFNHTKKKDSQIFVSSKILFEIDLNGKDCNILVNVDTDNVKCYSLQESVNWDSKTLALAYFIPNGKDFFQLSRFIDMRKEYPDEYLYTESLFQNIIIIVPLTSEHNNSTKKFTVPKYAGKNPKCSFKRTWKFKWIIKKLDK